jgi:hypothetical protein
MLILMFVAYIPIVLTIYVGQPHYAAPITAAFYVFTLLILRDLFNHAPGGRPVGRLLVRSVFMISVLLFVVRAAAPIFGLTPHPSWIRTWCSQDEQNLGRARILKKLQNTPGKHLVIVRYEPGHDTLLNEWVFNNADIDRSKVIWARDMGHEKNEELLRYFKERQVWLVEPDFKPIELRSYPEDH